MTQAGTTSTFGVLRGAPPGEVGFLRERGHLAVAFPKAYAGRLDDIESDRLALIYHAGLLARVLRSYRDDLAQQAAVEYGARGDAAAEIADTGGLLDLLDAAAELHQDFRRNGLFYVKNVRLAHDPSGAIEWNRTILRAPALIAESEVLYFETIHRSRRRDPFDLFHRLHASILREVNQIFGDPNYIADEVVLDDEHLSEIRASPEAFLAPIRERMFRERGRRLVDLISQFLSASARSASAGSGDESALRFTTDFEFVWEYVVRSLFENSAGRAISRLAAGRWLDLRTGVVRPGIRPRADVLRAVDAPGQDRFSYVCLLDAKDKMIDASGNRSGSEQDLYKQVMYAHLLGPEIADRWLNVLIFPYLGIGRDESFYRILGCHWWPTLPASPVFELGLSYATACEAVLFERTLDIDEPLSALLAADAGMRRE